MTFSAGTHLGRYQIVSALGAGGMGEVYRARDTRLDRTVALKVLPADVASRTDLRERLEREARAVSRLNHPHICALYDIGEQESIIFLVMEYVEGETLASRVSKGPLSPAQVLRYGIETASALEEAHGHGVVHRDLKPSNIMLTKAGAKVLDFGLAKFEAGQLTDLTRSRASLTEVGVIVGTLPYMSPEVLRGEPADTRSDLWALGVVLYEMATGELPFRGPTGFSLTAAILHEPPVPPPASVPVGLGAIIERCLTKEPSRRYSHASEARAALEAFLSDPSIAPPRPAAPHNLPLQLTSFIGRGAEMAEVTRLLARERLVTLAGAGGSGKTRLALQVARGLVSEFVHGVWLVELAALSDPELVPQTLMSTLGTQEEPGRPVIQALTEYLRTRSALLVLDNCEHLIGACAQLANALLTTCPRVKMLTTSREPLSVGGEHAWRVPSLSLPDLHTRLAPDVLAHSDAVSLFVNRAQVIVPSFTITNENAAAVAEICHRLDGIPLAIELATARTRILSVQQIAARLDDRFRLLTGGSRTAVPRQQTLRAAIDWSYDLLTDAERRLLCSLSVFAGGWTLQAAEQVCAGEGFAELETLDLLSRLVDKSLVTVEDDFVRDRRYRLLEIVRQYGRDRLAESGKAAQAQQRHATFYGALAARAEPELRGPEQVAWLNRLHVEHDNLRATLEWCHVERDRGEIGLAMTGALWWFWLKRGYFGEGRRWLDRTLASGTGAANSLRAKALLGAGVLAYFQGDYRSARSLLEDSVTLAREAEEERATVMALFLLGIIAGEQGDYARATALAEACLAASHGGGDPWLTAHPHELLGLIALYKGDYQRATSCFEDSLVLMRAAGDTWTLAMLLYNLGDTADHEGQFERARNFGREQVTLCHQMGDIRGIIWGLELLARVAGAQGKAQRAARLAGAASALMDTVGVQLPPTLRRPHERCLTSARDELGDRPFAAAWAEGRRMPVQEILADALAHEDGP